MGARHLPYLVDSAQEHVFPTHCVITPLCMISIKPRERGHAAAGYGTDQPIHREAFL